MGKYVAKPVEAVQFISGNTSAIRFICEMDGQNRIWSRAETRHKEIMVQTQYLLETPKDKDWIIKDAEGNLSIMTDELFKQIYERVKE